MDVKTLQEQMRKLSTIVDGWESLEKMSEIERDLVLEKLRALYEVVRFFDVVPAADAEPEAPVEIDLGADFSLDALSLNVPSYQESAPWSEPENELEQEPVSELESASDSEPEPEPEPLPEPEPMLVVESLPEPDSEPDPQSVDESKEQDEVEEESSSETRREAVAAPTLFGLESDEEVLRHRRKQRVIISLYHNESAQSEVGALAALASAAASEQSEVESVSERTVEPKQPVGYAAEPAEEDPFGEEDPFEEITMPKSVGDIAPGAVLGDVINHDRQTLADTIAPPRASTSDLRRSELVGDLRRAIGLNDRFLLVRDLFDGDGDACDATLEALNGFDDLDDCMIYIAENYVWNPNSDGAKFLMELIERKFSQPNG